MKKYLIIFSVVLMSFAKSDEPIERIGVNGPLNFNGTNFNLSWTDHPNDYYYIQEYLPKKEKPEHFNQMVTLHLFDKNIDIADAVKQKVNELVERKKTDPVCNYKIIKSPDGKEFIVDFLLGESRDNSMTIIEFNIYRYKQVELSNGKTGILVYAYSKRRYEDDIIDFLKNLGDFREKTLKVMATCEIPTIKL